MATCRIVSAAELGPLLPGVLELVGAICAMHQALDPVRYDFVPDVTERYRRWLPQRAADPGSVVAVATAESGPSTAAEEVIGFLVAERVSSIPIYQTMETGWIHDVYVHPAHRGLGVGRTLARLALDRFETMGVKQVRLETAWGNPEARRMFESMGFRPSAVEMLRQA